MNVGEYIIISENYNFRGDGCPFCGKKLHKVFLQGCEFYCGLKLYHRECLKYEIIAVCPNYPHKKRKHLYAVILENKWITLDQVKPLVLRE